MYQWYIVHKRWLVYIAALIYWAGRELSSARWQLQGIKQKLITLKSHWLNYNSLVADYNSGHRWYIHASIRIRVLFSSIQNKRFPQKQKLLQKFCSNQSACLFGLTYLLIRTVLIEWNKMLKWKSVLKIREKMSQIRERGWKVQHCG